jgi:hypothetical protein
MKTISSVQLHPWYPNLVASYSPVEKLPQLYQDVVACPWVAERKRRAAIARKKSCFASYL